MVDEKHEKERELLRKELEKVKRTHDNLVRLLDNIAQYDIDRLHQELAIVKQTNDDLENLVNEYIERGIGQ